MGIQSRRRQGRHLNRVAGANLTARERRGRHTASKRWVSGDNWVECQRCGHDVYASDAREDGYTRGLIVCPKCYDPPHPQDYVRAYEDRISPAGPVTGAADYDTTAATGSTTPPQGTFLNAAITVGTIADQTSVTTDVISLDAATGIWPTLYDVWASADDNVSSYAAANLPVGLSINASTGLITGTITFGTEGGSPYASKVTVTYASGRQLATAFTWTVTTAAGAPDTISGLSDWAWWDFSEIKRGDFGVWQDINATTAAVTGTVMKRCDDRSGNGYHVQRDGTGQNWVASILNGRGGGDFTGVGIGTLPSVGGAIAENAAAWSMFIVFHLDSANNSGTMMGGVGTGTPITWNFSPFEDTAELRFYRIEQGNTGGAGPAVLTSTLLWNGTRNRYYWFYFEFDQSASSVYIDGSLDATGSAWPNTAGPGDIAIGTDGVGGNNMRSYVLEAGIFDKKLSVDERTALYDYHNGRYGLDGQ